MISEPLEQATNIDIDSEGFNLNNQEPEDDQTVAIKNLSVEEKIEEYKKSVQEDPSFKNYMNQVFGGGQ